MPNRVIYQVEALFAGVSPSTAAQFTTGAVDVYANAQQIHRVQSANYSYTINRTDVNQFGELAAIDRVSLEPPTVSLDFTYLNQSFQNELALGFWIGSGQGDGQQSCLTDILNQSEGDRNYWIQTSTEGVDAIGQLSPSGTNPITNDLRAYIGIGNGFLSNYTTEASVGDFPRTTVTVEGLNMNFANARTGAPYGVPITIHGVSGGYLVASPAVNQVDGVIITGDAFIPNAISSPQISSLSVLRPGDITLDFYGSGSASVLDEIGVSLTGIKIQSYNLSFGLNREPLQRLGNKFAFSREITFPVTVSLRVDANVGNILAMANGGSGTNLADVLINNNAYDCAITLKHPTTSAVQQRFILKNATLDSQAFTSSIGPNKAVSLTWNSQVGGPNQTDRGLFMTGVCADIIAPQA